MSVLDDPCKLISVQLTQRELILICGSLFESSGFGAFYAGDLRLSANAAHADLEAADRIERDADDALNLWEKLRPLRESRV